MRQKKDIQWELNEFLTHWDLEEMTEFFRLVEPLIELYSVTEKEDWVEDEVGEDNVRNVRLIRTVYLISRICERFAGRMVGMNVRFKDLWKRLEKHKVAEVNEEALT